jgi:hypothetical protein
MQGTSQMEVLMEAVKKNKGGELNVSNKKMSVDPPKGYHWMMDRGRYFLMKGEYKPHPKAVETASFKLVNHS